MTPRIYCSSHREEEFLGLLSNWVDIHSGLAIRDEKKSLTFCYNFLSGYMDSVKKLWMLCSTSRTLKSLEISRRMFDAVY